MRFAVLVIAQIVCLGFLIPQLTQMAVAQAVKFGYDEFPEFRNVKSMLNIPMEEVPNESNDKTTGNTTGTDSGNITGTEQMALKAQLKSEPYLKDFYAIKKFGFVASNGSEICPQNNCKYGVEGGQLSTFGGGSYLFYGKLKVTTQEGDVKKSKLYDFSLTLDKTGEEERNGKRSEFLDGTFGVGPDISYDITNATLSFGDKNPVLTIQGERS